MKIASIALLFILTLVSLFTFCDRKQLSVFNKIFHKTDDKLVLFSFDQTIQGWKVSDVSLTNGMSESEKLQNHVSRTQEFSVIGKYGLAINSTNAWFAAELISPKSTPSIPKIGIDLSHYNTIKYDLKTFAVGAKSILALQVGKEWRWCQSPGNQWIPAHTEETVTVTISDLRCTSTPYRLSLSDLEQVNSLAIFFPKGRFYLDYIRAE